MNFEQITPSDYPRLKPFFKNQRYPLCVYSLLSLLSWRNEAYQPYGAIEDDTLVVCAEFTTRTENRHMILPVSPTHIYSPEALHALANRAGFDTYWFVPEDYIAQYGEQAVKTFFKVREHSGYADYVFRTQDMVSLKGNKYSKKRNLIHQFKRQYQKKDRIRIERITPSTVEDCMVFLEEWCMAHDCGGDDEQDLACEKQAAINALENIDILRGDGILLRIDDDVSAFAIASGLTREMGALHFEKAFNHIKGLYQYFDNQCARRLFKGYTYINKESDMDLPGLARSKKSYHPVRMVRSYRLLVRK